MKIYEKIEISAAHQLKNHDGKCKNFHGHNYIVEVWIEHERIDEETNMVADFGKIKKAVMELDHKDLNEIMEEDNPTAEKIVLWIISRLENFIRCHTLRVRVWEDRDSYAEDEVHI
uniref:Putative 6-Pyruvoyl tetrahydrobiopterin synthase n=1 Tax=viral metagenome TaxID=1070528 RepID=A0A6M3X5X9_9ZZZZ